MELYQCPYNKSCKCAMTDPCLGCEDFNPSAVEKQSKQQSNCNKPAAIIGYVLLAICIFLLIIWIDYSIIVANIDGFKHGFDDRFLSVFIPLISFIILIIQPLIIKKYCS